MIPYFSRTGTRRALAAFRAMGARLMISARGVLRTEGFAYALDNGAWTAFQEHLAGKRPTPVLDLAAFVHAVDRLGAGADFIIVPDIVMGGEASWMLTRYWLRRLRRDRRLKGVRLMIAVQNGMEPELVRPYLSARVGVFVGGDVPWKLATMGVWAKVAHERGAVCHVGRVNTGRRVRLCEIAGVDSFDGSGPSRFVDCLPPITDALRQTEIEGWLSRHPICTPPPPR